MRLFVAAEFASDAPGGGAAVIRQALSDFPGRIYWWSARRPQMPSSSFIHNNSPSVLPIFRQYHFSPGIIFPLKRWTRFRASLMYLFWVRAASWHLSLRIKEVLPDKIWFIPFEWSILVFHQLVSSHFFKRLQIPFHVSIQDFPNTRERKDRWGLGLVRTMALRQENLYRIANSRDATSIPMLVRLKRRTRKSGLQMMHAGVESADFQYIRRSRPTKFSVKTIMIAYAGTIIVPQEFEAFVKHLDYLRKCFFCSIELVLWSAHSYRSSCWFQQQWMREEGHLSEPELRKQLRRMSWGFIPMGLTTRDSLYNRYSFPTKFISYLAAGLPIISFGHPESSLMQITNSYRVGIRCTSKMEMARLLTPSALSDPQAKTRFQKEILRCGSRLFCANKIRMRLWKCLSSGVSL